MAAPTAAGNALLLRQYFQDPDHKFWLAVCSSLHSACRQNFSPSGALLKALLLHSGSAMTLYNGGGSEDVPLSGPPPDRYQGYGRVTLANVLPLPGVYTKFSLFVEDDVELAEYTTATYSIVVAKKRKGFIRYEKSL